MVNIEEELIDKYSSEELLNAFISKEIAFRLKEIHDLSDEKINIVKDDIINHFQDNTDLLFDYDSIDNTIERLTKILLGYR